MSLEPGQHLYKSIASVQAYAGGERGGVLLFQEGGDEVRFSSLGSLEFVIRLEGMFMRSLNAHYLALFIRVVLHVCWETYFFSVKERFWDEMRCRMNPPPLSLCSLPLSAAAAASLLIFTFHICPSDIASTRKKTSSEKENGAEATVDWGCEEGVLLEVGVAVLQTL